MARCDLAHEREAIGLAYSRCLASTNIVKILELFQPVKGCLSCARVQRSNDSSIKCDISNKQAIFSTKCNLTYFDVKYQINVNQIERFV